MNAAYILKIKGHRGGSARCPGYFFPIFLERYGLNLEARGGCEDFEAAGIHRD